MSREEHRGWIGVDLDGTLAAYDGWQGLYHIGDPVPAMVERIKAWLDEGWDVRIFTARLAGLTTETSRACETAIRDWLSYRCDLPRLLVTNVKDFDMVELWDDRAVTVEANTGKQLAPSNINRGIA